MPENVSRVMTAIRAKIRVLVFESQENTQPSNTHRGRIDTETCNYTNVSCANFSPVCCPSHTWRPRLDVFHDSDGTEVIPFARRNLGWLRPEASVTTELRFYRHAPASHKAFPMLSYEPPASLHASATARKGHLQREGRG